MGRRKVRSLGVDWHLPAAHGGFQARPFASTTVADSLELELVAERGPTWGQALGQLPFPSAEQREVIAGFCEAGYADTLMAEHINVPKYGKESP